jgi:TIR domain-containing protein
MIPKAKGLGPGSDVFVAFAQPDQAWAEWIADVLRDTGRSVATARDVTEPGQPIERSLAKAIGTARELFLIASERALKSPWVRAELAWAQAAGKPTTVVVVDEAARLPSDLSGARVVYLTDSSLPADRRRLVEALERPSTDTAHAYAPIESQSIKLPATFVDRRHELQLLREVFLPDRSRPPATVVVTGPPGIGKTALAAMFVHRHEHDFAAVQWLNYQHNPSAINRPQIEHNDSKKPGLSIIDDAENYESISEMLSTAGSDHVLVLSRAHLWGRPFEVVPLDRLDPASAAELVRHFLPSLDPADAARIAQAVGGTPAYLNMASELARTRSLSEFLDTTQSFKELAKAVAREHSGYYYLDTDDPRMISNFERAIEEVLRADSATIDLVDRHRGSWGGWWRRRYTPDRVDAIADRAERAAEVAALTKPEGEANRDNAEAIARLIEASAAIPNMVVICSSVLLIKVTDGSGQRLVSKTLTATELRRFEQREELLANPAQALEFLQASEGDNSALPPG